MAPAPLILLAVLMLTPAALSLKQYQRRIPNGERVPSPTGGGSVTWQGVGHTNANGGGARNVFGRDFQAHGHSWSEDLCSLDSDGDGRTNGEELGDPRCEWTEGDADPTDNELSHPGICEPITSDHCKEINQDIDFESSAPFNCPATESPDVTASTFRFPATEVPAKETHYVCQYFPLDLPASEHMIAFVPVLDNEAVMHHITVYGCRPGQGDALRNLTLDGPVACGESMTGCQEIVAVWTLGINGQCFPDDFGMLLGDGGFTALWMELHWNNPQEIADTTDSSGVTLYHTSTLRAHNGGYVFWGTQTVELPPGESHVLQSGGCLAECLQGLAGTVYISQIMPHMHYYGRATTVSVNDRRIMEEREYDYDSPSLINFDPPEELSRGDRIGVTCTYTTTGASRRTYWGLATADEMCFAIALVHPVGVGQGVPTFCQEADGYGWCDGAFHGPDWGACDLTTYWASLNYTALTLTLEKGCDPTGLECWDGCEAAIAEALEGDPCLGGEMARLIRGYLSLGGATNIIDMLTSCDEVVYDPEMGGDGGVSDGANTLSGGLLSALLVTLVLLLVDARVFR